MKINAKCLIPATLLFLCFGFFAQAQTTSVEFAGKPEQIEGARMTKTSATTRKPMRAGRPAWSIMPTNTTATSVFGRTGKPSLPKSPAG